jgi:hypothetical protein
MHTFNSWIRQASSVGLLFTTTALLSLTQREVYDLHHRMSESGDRASILYGYCALETGCIKDFCAFAPDSTAIARLTRLLFFIQPWDGEMVATGNPISAIPQMGPEMWGRIVALLSGLPSNTEKEESLLKTVQEKIENLISEGLSWEKQVFEADKKIQSIIMSDVLAAKIKADIEALVDERDTLKKKEAADQTKNAFIKRLNEIGATISQRERALKKRIAALPTEMRAGIARAKRDEKSPQTRWFMPLQSAPT